MAVSGDSAFEPVFGEMAWATAGQGAFLNDQPIRVAASLEPHSSCVSTGNIQSLIEKNWQGLGQLLSQFSKIRGYGDFYHYHFSFCCGIFGKFSVYILQYPFFFNPKTYQQHSH